MKKFLKIIGLVCIVLGIYLINILSLGNIGLVIFIVGIFLIAKPIKDSKK